MLDAIRAFFDQHLAAQRDDDEATVQRRTQLAAAALLVEVIRQDEHISAQEREQVLASVTGKFGLDARQAGELIALAEAEVHQATDLYQFTSKINRHFDAEQKVVLIEHMWRAALADGTLHKYEEHLIRKVAELLHVPHTAFIAVKHRAANARTPTR